MPGQATQEIVLAWIQGLLPTMTAVVGALWIAYKYVDEKREAQEQNLRQAESEAATRALEARKPFLDRQLAIYFEAAEVAGKIVTIEDFKNDEWRSNRLRFSQLFWTVLSLVEDDKVKDAMVKFSDQLDLVESMTVPGTNAPEAARSDLEQRAYGLARSFKESLENSWDVETGLVIPKAKRPASRQS
jgi:hypothetical protein